MFRRPALRVEGVRRSIVARICRVHKWHLMTRARLALVTERLHHGHLEIRFPIGHVADDPPLPTFMECNTWRGADDSNFLSFDESIEVDVGVRFVLNVLHDKIQICLLHSLDHGTSCVI
eukprot:GEMP01097457.1.p1 GENE.GEMP01097457.1~~GEMP01097457.1.p1  ORF type:complete len:119 (-),score=16.77 GEMP01097457.1:311-667(-)